MRAVLTARGFEVEECSTIGTALRQAQGQRPDICLVDAELLDSVNGATAALAELEKESRIVVLAQSATAEEVLAALDAGAAGYLLKDVNTARLANHLLDVINGHVAISPALVTDLLAQRLEVGSVLE